MDETPVTALFYLNTPKSLNAEDAESDAGRVFHQTIGVIARNSGRPVYWGRMLEDPDKVVILIIFKSLDDRLAAQRSDWRRDCYKQLMSISTAHLTIWHIEFNHDITQALNSPVTTLAQAFFDPSEESAERRDAFFGEHYQLYQAKYSNGPGGPLAGLFAGWSLEDDMPYIGISDGKARKGKVFVMASGWNSPDEMMGYHTLDTNIKWSVDAMETVDGWTVQNVKFNCTRADLGST